MFRKAIALKKVKAFGLPIGLIYQTPLQTHRGFLNLAFLGILLLGHGLERDDLTGLGSQLGLTVITVEDVIHLLHREIVGLGDILLAVVLLIGFNHVGDQLGVMPTNLSPQDHFGLGGASGLIRRPEFDYQPKIPGERAVLSDTVLEDTTHLCLEGTDLLFW